MTTVREFITRWGFEADDAPLNRLDSQISSLQTNIRRVTVAFAGATAGVGLLLREAGRFEQSQIAFTTILGGAEAAQAKLAELAEFAANTPFTLPGIEANAKSLLAVGIESEKLLPTLKALGDVSAGLSVPLERLALNFGQVRTQGKLTGREVRDFAVAGVPIVAELAKNLGKTEKQIQELVSKGAIGFEEVEAAFISMTSGSGAFADLMDKQSRSFFGILSNISDSLILLARDVGQELLPEAKALVSEFQEWMSVNKAILKQRLSKFVGVLVKFIKDMVKVAKGAGQVINSLADRFGGLENVLLSLSAAVAAFISLQMVSVLGSIVIAASKATAGLGLLALSFGRVGNAAVIAKLKMLALPIAVGAAFIGLLLIIEDIVGYLDGKKSVTGMLLGDDGGSGLIDRFTSGITSMMERLTKMIAEFGTKAGRAIVGWFDSLTVEDFKRFGNVLLKALELVFLASTLPLRIGEAIGRGILQAMTNIIKTEFPVMAKALNLDDEGLKKTRRTATAIATPGVGTRVTGNTGILGFSFNTAAIARAQGGGSAAAMDGLVRRGAAPGNGPAPSIKNEVQVNINGSGLDEQQLRRAVGDAITDSTSTMLRETKRSVNPAVVE